MKFILTSRNIAGRKELKKNCGFSQIRGYCCPRAKMFLLATSLCRTGCQSLLSIYTQEDSEFPPVRILSCCTFIVVLPGVVLPLSDQKSHFLRLFHRQIKSCRLGNSSPKLCSTHFIKKFSLLPRVLMKNLLLFALFPVQSCTQ